MKRSFIVKSSNGKDKYEVLIEMENIETGWASCTCIYTSAYKGNKTKECKHIKSIRDCLKLAKRYRIK